MPCYEFFNSATPTLIVSGLNKRKTYVAPKTPQNKNRGENNINDANYPPDTFFVFHADYLLRGPPGNTGSKSD